MTPSWLDHLALVSAGLALAALAALPARRLLRRDPSACYRLFLALLLGALALLPLQWLLQGTARDLAAPAREELERWLEPPLDGTILVRAPEARERGADSETAASWRASASGDSAASGTPAATPAAPAERLAIVGETNAGVGPPAIGRLQRAARSLAAKLRGPLGLALWWLGVALVAARRAIVLLPARRLIRKARAVEDAAVLTLWRRVAGSSKVAGRVRLLSSTQVSSPACAGWLRPVLLLPAGRGPLDEGALAWALRHELVHLERRDSLVAGMQELVTALLWFHPAAWWLSAEIGRLRELSCDQEVVRASGRRRSYALALLEYAAARNGPIEATDAGPHSAGVSCALLHWSRSPSQIQRRIEMLTMEWGGPSRARRLLGRTLALCVFVVPALAQVGAAAAFFPGEEPTPAAASAVPVAADACGDEDEAARCKKARKDEKAIRALHEGLAKARQGAQAASQKTRARAAELRAKLAAAEGAGDEEACAALAAALERCEAECAAAAEACEADGPALEEALARLGKLDGSELAEWMGDLGVELEDLGERLGDLELGDLDLELGDFDVDLGDLELDLGDLDVDLEGFEFDLGDLTESLEEIEDIEVEVPSFDVDFELPPVEVDVGAIHEALAQAGDRAGAEYVDRRIEEQVRRAVAKAQRQVVEASSRLADAQRRVAAVAGQGDREGAREEHERAMAKHREALARSHEALEKSLAKLRARMPEIAEQVRRQAHAHAGGDGKPRKLKLRAGGREKDPQAAPPPVEPAAPGAGVHPRTPRLPRQAGIPGMPESHGVAPAPHPPAPPAAPRFGLRRGPPQAGAEEHERALLERIHALEDEIAVLRAALEQARAEKADPAPRPGRRTRRT
jgi:beta-lactamase regulating signal transducer with metallopeptidase domain